MDVDSGIDVEMFEERSKGTKRPLHDDEEFFMTKRFRGNSTSPLISFSPSSINSSPESKTSILTEDMICEEEDSSFSEYMEETFTHRKGIEDRQTAKIENCLKGQTMVSADGRKVLVEWLAKVQRHLNLSFESFFMAVALVDRFLKTTPISSDCLQLTGITALLVSSKMEDIYPPLIADLIRLSANAYTRVHVIMMERYMLSRLRFDIATSTPLFFFDWYSAKMRTVNVSNEKLAKSRALARFILEKAIADYDLSQLRASHLALATLKLVNDAFLIPAFGITSMNETDTLKTIIRLEIVMKENLKETPLDKVYRIYSLD